MDAAFSGIPYGGRGPRSAEAPLEEAVRRELGARLLLGLEAAERAEGEPFEHSGMDASAALLVVRADADPGSGSDRLVDLRVDQGEDPVSALGRLYARDSETFLPAAHVRFGDAARRRGEDAAARREYAAAEAGFRAAVARAPKDAGALNELAWFLATRGGDASEALRFAEAAVLARGDDPNILDTLAEAAYRAGDLEKAIGAAERAARLARGNARYDERLRAFRAARAALKPSSR
jgi:tetratricopeptide (TPR) repeat protein